MQLHKLQPNIITTKSDNQYATSHDTLQAQFNDMVSDEEEARRAAVQRHRTRVREKGFASLRNRRARSDEEQSKANKSMSERALNESELYVYHRRSAVAIGIDDNIDDNDGADHRDDDADHAVYSKSEISEIFRAEQKRLMS
jgi:hypothetical protein